ncbi:hypothetical protein AAE478_008654 [Parahypoxylon ruwenzoriense]
MSEPRSRYAGRRSPTFNPTRASMPVSVGYDPHYSGDLHTVQTARYDASVPRRANDHNQKTTPAAPTTTVTTYNVTKDPAPPRNPAQAARRRSSTVDSTAVKPIIVTTNHASRPHGSASHASSSATQTTSPSRDPYRSSDETYYTQPASSIRSRSQHRNGHGYSQSATLSNDEFHRLRERVGDDRLRVPAPVPTDYYRYPLPHVGYTNPPHANTSAVLDYENEGYEYTKPSDLARYDLDHDRQSRKSRRDSLDRPYYRPTVNVVSNDPGRYDSRNRGPPPTSVGLERYNRSAAVGMYDRPTVTMPSLPPVPAPPPVEPLRRIEGPRNISTERTSERPRPVSLYQDAPARMSHPDDLYRSRDDERVHGRRARDDAYRDDDVTSRGFGIRTNSLEPPDTLASALDRRDHDDRHARRDVVDREPRRHSDEALDNNSRGYDSRKPAEDTTTRIDASRDRKDNITRKNSIGGRTFDRFTAGLGAAAASLGLSSKEAPKEEDRKVSPRRRDTDDEKDALPSRAADKYKPKEKDIPERKPSPREEQPLPERRREYRGERAESVPTSRDREFEKERARERDIERENERDLWEREKSEWEKERERERNRRDAEAAPNGSAVEEDTRDNSPTNSDGSANTSRRRRRDSSTFDPTDTRGLMDLKAELAAKEEKEKPKEEPSTKEKTSDKEPAASASTERLAAESRDESRGRETSVPAQKEEKQVRVVSPPREKAELKPIKGILKPPSAKFPEEQNPIREGVAPHKDDKSKKDVPPGARWTKISRKLVNPSALEIGKERFEVRDDFVIVLRVLSKEEIQAYATATAQIRAEARRREFEKELRGEQPDRDRSDEERRPPRRRRERDDDYEYRRDDERERDRDRDRERHRRHRRGSDSEDPEVRRRAIDYDPNGSSHHLRPHRSHRERDYDMGSVDDRR